MDARSKITNAIRQCCLDWPHVATALLRLRPTEKPGIGTAGADTRFRYNYDPEFIEAMDLKDLIYNIKLDVLSPLLRYHQRGQQMIFDQQSHKAFSTVSTLMLNQILKDDAQYIPEGTDTISTARLPDGSMYPSGLCLEEYFSLILDQLEEEEETGPGPGPDDSEQLTGGSSRDGIPREHEDDQPDDDMTEISEGVDDGELEEIIQKVREHSKSMGRFGGSFSKVLIEGKSKPKVSPQQLLRMAIAKHITKFRRGTKEATYRRPSRRSQVTDKYIRPSYSDPTPNITVVVDTSGSMTQEDRKLGLGMIDLAIKGMRLDSVRVVGADTDIRSDQKNIRRLADVNLQGCGGTCMDVVVNKILSEPDNQLPDLLILVTDGGTGWPNKHKVPFVACVTRGESSLWKTPPDWMPLVYVAS